MLKVRKGCRYLRQKRQRNLQESVLSHRVPDEIQHFKMLENTWDTCASKLTNLLDIYVVDE